jgi:formate dehydrogenase alpha subunit
VRITINGRTLEAQENQTVLQVARGNGIYIPSLCYHPKTGQAAKCRACVVAIEGMRGLQTSCTIRVREGMSVTTDSPHVLQAQKMVVDLLLSSGRHDCLSCERNGDCELQEAAYFLGIEHAQFAFPVSSTDIDSSSEFVYRDHSKCIACGRCVAGCNTTVVNEVLATAYRGRDTRIICDDDKPMGNSSCVQCGECVQLCPTGAIIDKLRRGLARTWQFEKVETICPYCGVGCRLALHIDRARQRVVRVTGVEDAPANEGMLCVKGRYGFDFLASAERLKTPLIRDKTGAFQPASWADALALIAARVTELRQKHGPDALAGLSSAKVTNEENYLFQKLMRKEMGTNNVDHCARLCHASTVAGLAISFGSGAMTNDFAGIRAADVILVIGSDTTSGHPVIAARIKQAVRLGKTKLIVIDPKRIRLADQATIYARQRCGTDVAVLNGIMHLIVKNGWHKADFVAQRCEGFEALKEELEHYTPAEVERISGIPAAQLHEIAALFGQAPAASVFYSMGITQHTTGVDNVMSIANLQMLCGNLGRPGTGVNALRGQNNVQGSCDMGALPNVFPAYQKVGDPAVQEKFEKAWGAKLPAKPGLTVTEIIDAALGGTIRGLYIMGENPILSDPDQQHVEKALANLEFLVVQDIFMTETARYAHVVLPAAAFAEKEGTFTNTERRVQLLAKALPPPGEALADWEILQNVARALGATDWNYRCAEDIFTEVRGLTPSYAGMTYERLGRAGLHWPCPSVDHPGTPVLHRDRFTRGLGLMKPIRFKEPAELPDSDYPLVMTTGRLLYQFHTGTMTRKTEGLDRLGGPSVMVSHGDADPLGIRSGDPVEVTTRRGQIRIQAFVTDQIGKGTVFIPFHFGEAPANRLTIGAVDPVAKIPEFKVCAARIAKAM